MYSHSLSVFGPCESLNRAPQSRIRTGYVEIAIVAVQETGSVAYIMFSLDTVATGRDAGRTH